MEWAVLYLPIIELGMGDFGLVPTYDLELQFRNRILPRTMDYCRGNYRGDVNKKLHILGHDAGFSVKQVQCIFDKMRSSLKN